MTIEEIRKGAPNSATHYFMDVNDVVYCTLIRNLGYWIIASEYYLDEYEVFQFKPKPL